MDISSAEREKERERDCFSLCVLQTIRCGEMASCHPEAVVSEKLRSRPPIGGVIQLPLKCHYEATLDCCVCQPSTVEEFCAVTCTRNCKFPGFSIFDSSDDPVQQTVFVLPLFT